jgi:KaiC/GvpD/RAD55 family RecA-like ATPase
LKVSKSFVIDLDVVKAFETTRDFFLNLGYEEKNEIIPKRLVFKKRMKIKTSTSSMSENIIRLKVEFNPVGNLQIYSTALITVKCDYVVKISGREASITDKKMFEAEANKLKEELASKILTKKVQVAGTESASSNLCKEICETSHIQVIFTQPKNTIRVGEKERIEVYIKNVGNTAIFLKKIKNILSEDFQPISSSDGEIVENGNLNLNRKRLRPQETDEITIIFEPLRSGIFQIKPRIDYLDSAGTQTFIECHTKVFKVLKPALPGRITTGYSELDNLLLGGLPEKYAIVLTAPSSDESEMLIKRFLRAGAKAGETTFFFTLESENGKALAKEFHSNFYLFIFNPRADGDIMNLHNVVKLNGVGNLSHIDIELTKSLRMLDSSQSRPRRICMEIISDILLQHKAVTTRKWLRGIISELKSNGFTIIAVVNPLMHPPDQVQAILGLFDGEISIFEKDTEEGVENILRVRRMYTQRYLKNELVLLREQLES